ncbi:Tim44-like domain protein [mine drainage metagenome]|uniref:Tim44-like domain protein n=1 Tax=mine drainage metagenome TaxID=410659 RepID=A0A1J5RY73_9ZZZZ
MKRFLLLFTIVLTSMSLLATSAEAKRFGGGGSFGKQRTMSAPAQNSPAAAPAPIPSQPGVTPQPAGNRWLGPLAGLAIGAGLGAMFAGGSMGGGMGSILMMILAGVAVMFLVSMFRRKQEPAMQYSGASGPYGGVQEPVRQSYGGSAAPVAAANIPADFPVESFLRSAKTSFIRLQAANDRKDLDDIREYTTPEMFAEVSMQLQERGDAPQKTDVVTLNADLLEVVTENDHAIASVRMSGQLRENNGTPESFDEIWHVQKNLKDNKAVWLLAGIQQV